MRTALILLAGLAALLPCACAHSERKTACGPDYSDNAMWLARPAQASSAVDIFYVHPTSFAQGEEFNEPASSMSANAQTRFTIENQASAYAKTGDIYAPYYRQAHIKVLRLSQAEQTPYLDLAYSDVKAAFEYYLANLNKGRPFILAGHSQGSDHLLRLLEEKFSDKSLRDRLVAAYLIGWSVTEQDLRDYPHLGMCQTPEQTSCLVSYNTVGEHPAFSIARPGSVVTNPLTWTLSKDPASKTLNLGARLFLDGRFQDFPQYTGAQVQGDALVVPAPENAAQLKLPFKDFYHTCDYPFFYRNIEANAALRARVFLENSGARTAQEAQ